METWFIIIVSLCISAVLKSLFDVLLPPFSNRKLLLPPGPPSFSGNFLWSGKSFSEIESVLRNLRLKYGPIITLYVGFRPAIFVASHSVAHRALVHNGAVFSDRPGALPTARLVNRDQHNISSSSYGPTWRLFRRNLASEILHPSRVKSFSWARSWVLGILLDRLQIEPSSSAIVVERVVDHFQYAMFCLLVLMCFGDKLDESKIKQVERVQRNLLLSFGSGRFTLLNFLPVGLGKLVFPNRWKELEHLVQEQEQVLIPLIKARIEIKDKELQQDDNRVDVVAYVDTLVNLRLPEEGNRKLTYEEMVGLCGEFLTAGTDTTSTALQWIMANLVKYPQIQDKLYQEIIGVVGPPPPPVAIIGGTERKGDFSITEEVIEKMPYLKAVVLESLRRHPPGHFVLPHTVTEETELEGYVVPKNASVNFMVADMGWDPNVWDDPMEFKPERFLLSKPAIGTATVQNSDETNNITSSDNVAGVTATFDITGSKEVKMMPFGAGRRICPASSLALLHLEYFVANLIWYLQWTAADGDDVDLSEKQEFTIVMKNPLRAHISPRHTKIITSQ